MTSSLDQAGSAVALNFAGRFGAHVINFGVGVVLARLVAPQHFGALAIALVFVALVSSLAEAGLATALVQRRHLRPCHYDSVWLASSLVGAFFVVLVWLVATTVAAFYDEPDLVGILRALSSLVLINGVTNVPQAVLRRNLEFGKVTVSRLAGGLVGGTLGVSLAWFGYEIWSLVWQQIGQAIIAGTMITFFSRWRPGFQFSPKAIRQLAAFGSRIYASRVLDTVTARLDVFLFGRLLPLDSLAQYQRAKSFNTLLMGYSFQSLVEVLFPFMSQLSHSRRKVGELLRTAMAAVIFVSFGIIGAIQSGGFGIVEVLYGPNWSRAGEILLFVSAASFALPISTLLMSSLASIGQSSAYFRTELAKKAALILHLAAGYFFGFDVFLWLFLLRSILAVAINIEVVSRQFRVPRWDFWKPLLQQGFLCAALSIAVRLTPFEDHIAPAWALGAAAFMILYLLTSKLLRTEPWNACYPYLQRGTQWLTVRFHGGRLN